MECQLRVDAPAVAVFDPDWGVLRRVLPGTSAPRIAHLLQGRGKPDETETLNLRQRLLGLPPHEALTEISTQLSQAVSTITSIPADQLEPQKNLAEFGMDSLMAVELSLSIEDRFGVNIPNLSLAQGGTIAALAQRIALGLSEPENDKQPDTMQDVASRHLAENERAALVEATPCPGAAHDEE